MTPHVTRGSQLEPHTVFRQLLARRLKTLRLARAKKLSEVAAQLGFSTSKLSRLENDERAPQVEDVARLAEFYELSPSDTAELVQFAIGARLPSPWTNFQAAAPERDYFELEAAARRVQAVDLLQIHGLLQLPDYTAALLVALGIASADSILESRRLRQRRLTDLTPFTLEVVLGEAALWTRVGSPKVMREQVAHLLAMSQLPAVVVQVLPFDAGPSVAHMGSFGILEFGQNVVADVVYLEGLTGQLVIKAPGSVARYQEGFQTVAQQALSSQTTRTLLESVHEHWSAQD